MDVSFMCLISSLGDCFLSEDVGLLNGSYG